MSAPSSLSSERQDQFVTERLASCRRLMAVGLAITPFTTPGIALVALKASTPERVTVWAVATSIVAWLALAALWLPRRRLARSVVSIAVPMGAISVMWGLLPFVVVRHDAFAFASLVLQLVAVVMTAAVAAAGSVWSFTALSVPAVTLTSVWLATAPNADFHVHAPLMVSLWLVALAVNRGVGALVNRAVRSSLENEQLSDELQIERIRIDEANGALVTANHQLRHQANHDALTGLLNRHGLTGPLEAAVTSASAESMVALFYLDLDHFKIVNDSLGHLAGDRLLCVVAERIERAAPNGAIVARLGGDEFAVVVPGVSSGNDANHIGAALAAALSDPVSLDGRALSAHASIGVALCRGDGGVSDLFRFADTALYEAKGSGRNRVAVFDDDLRGRVDQALDAANELRRAIDQRDIVAWYQPKVDLRTGQVVGAEALARWYCGDRVKSAVEFMPLASQLDLLSVLSEQISTQVFTDRLRWHQQGLDSEFRVTVNASANQLGNPRREAQARAFLEQSGLPPGALGVELTETELVVDPGKARRAIAFMRSIGLRISLDDFGTGHSSLSMLQLLELDEIKIDRAFLRNIEQTDRDGALVRAVLDLAIAYELDVVAEGVETIEQARVLQRMGCTVAQGFLFAPAMPAEQLLAIMERDAPFASVLALAS
jgi:diguanylate cyclase (GGDEF)-like protein